MRTSRILAGAIPLLFAAAACGGDAEEPPATPMVDIANATVIEDGVLGGGQPDEAQLRRAAEAGYRTIVNTRGSAERDDFADEEELVRSLGMDYVFIPIGQGEPLDEAKARKLAEVLAAPDALPAMVHCRSGNRVGALFAAKAFLVDGVDATEALEFGTASGMRRAPAELETLLGTGGPD